MSALHVGILGGGQLAERLALAGYPLGLRFRVFDPSPDAPAGHLAPHVVAGFDDLRALAEFAKGLTHVTVETESVPAASLEMLQSMGVEVRPGPRSLDVTGDRLNEKEWLSARGIPTAPWAAAADPEELAAAVERLGGAVIAKTRTDGYDGKGQVHLDPTSDARAAWSALGGRPLVVERKLGLRRELSQVSVRSASGEVRHYPLVENRHEGGILRETLAPAKVDAVAEALAQGWAEQVAAGLEHVGVITLELFDTDDGLVVNEIAPRVHNSGHWTIEAATCSQFESHVRAVVGWPLRPTEARGHARMVNYIGVSPEVATTVDPEARVHVYRKDPRPGRKLGHVTLMDDDPERLAVRSARLASGAAASSSVSSAVFPDDALLRLRSGSERVQEGCPQVTRWEVAPGSQAAPRETRPFAAVLACSDAGVPPELLFDQPLGSFHTLRVAGNVATADEIAGIEHAVMGLGVSVVVVLGHGSCRTLAAALTGDPDLTERRALHRRLQPAVERAGDDLDLAVELNVAQQLAFIRGASHVVRHALDAGTLRLEGCIHDPATGRMRFLDSTQIDHTLTQECSTR